MQCLEISGAVRPIYGSLVVKRLSACSLSAPLMESPSGCAEQIQWTDCLKMVSVYAEKRRRGNLCVICCTRCSAIKVVNNSDVIEHDAGYV